LKNKDLSNGLREKFQEEKKTDRQAIKKSPAQNPGRA
jgi:hypothetical protein